VSAASRALLAICAVLVGLIVLAVAAFVLLALFARPAQGAEARICNLHCNLSASPQSCGRGAHESTGSGIRRTTREGTE
jgi:hypothetical protein